MTFFSNSDFLDTLVLRPLSHIRGNWECRWDHASSRYASENDSFADELSDLIEEIGNTIPPARYHSNEDQLAIYVQQSLGWQIQKVGGRWIGADYDSILEQGGFHDVNQAELVQAIAGRTKAAINHGQTHFDEMEESHQRMLAAVMSIVIYHRA